MLKVSYTSSRIKQLSPYCSSYLFQKGLYLSITIWITRYYCWVLVTRVFVNFYQSCLCWWFEIWLKNNAVQTFGITWYFFFFFPDGIEARVETPYGKNSPDDRPRRPWGTGVPRIPCVANVVECHHQQQQILLQNNVSELVVGTKVARSWASDTIMPQ